MIGPGTVHRIMQAPAGLPASSLVDPLAGRWCRLRAVGPADAPALHQIATDGRIGYRWRFQGIFPSLETFTNGLWNDVLAQCAVLATAGPEVIGHVVAYSPDLRNARAHFGIVMRADMTGTGIGMEATWLFLSYLFDTWPLHKVYVEVPEHVLGSYRSLTNYGFTEEAVLRAHSYHGGKYWDERILAVDRVTWTERVAAAKARRAALVAEVRRP
jgi:RimJ/RimL family protein N-acetyltransferase